MKGFFTFNAKAIIGLLLLCPVFNNISDFKLFLSYFKLANTKQLYQLNLFGQHQNLSALVSNRNTPRSNQVRIALSP